MKVKDLKKLLETFDDELDILRFDSQGGYYDLDEVKAITYCRDVNNRYYHGPHEVIESKYDVEKYKLNDKFKCLLLT